MQRKAPVGQAIGLFCLWQQETPDNKVPSCAAVLLCGVKVEIHSELSMCFQNIVPEGAQETVEQAFSLCSHLFGFKMKGESLLAFKILSL